jgi:23S rRNA (pseudouridine1915-N3)-methyltransferase
LRLLIAAVGHTRGALADAEDDYVAMAMKLGRPIGLRGLDRPAIAQSKAATAAQRRDDEAARIAEATRGSRAFALDPGGKLLSTDDLAALVRGGLEGGAGSLAFVIGGPDGLSSSIRQTSAGLISFGRLTWPHRLVRVMLAEQIYRVVTILVNHPYHRGG